MALNRDEFQNLFKTDFDNVNLNGKLHPSSFFKDNLCFSENTITLQFGDEFYTEQSVCIFLTTVGFSHINSGTKYLTYILSECINDMDSSIHTAKYFNKCSERFNIKPNNIRIAIEKAIERAAKKSVENRLSKINEILNADYITGTKMSASTFITFVAQRFILLKKYGRTIHYSANRSNIS